MGVFLSLGFLTCSTDPLYVRCTTGNTSGFPQWSLVGVGVEGSSGSQWKYKIMLLTVQWIVKSFICGSGNSCSLPESVKLWQIHFASPYICNHKFFLLFLVLRNGTRTYTEYIYDLQTWCQKAEIITFWMWIE